MVGNRNIYEWGKYLSTKDSSAWLVEHTGTLFKLYALYAYLLFPYLPIIRGWRLKKQNYRKFIYIDLFAGNGLNQINEGDNIYHICGSAILAIFASYVLSKKENSYFDAIIAVDSDKKSKELLADRICLITKELNLKGYSVSDQLGFSSNVMTLHGDVTDSEFIDKIRGHLQQLLDYLSINIMFFIDPPTPEALRAQMLRALLAFPGDVLLLLHTGIFAEIVNKKRYNRSKLAEMLGIDLHDVNRLYSKTRSSEELQDYYVSRYRSIISGIEIQKIQAGSKVRDVIKTVEIRTKSSHYVLLYATRKTGGQDSEKWQNAFEQFAKEIGKLSESGDLALQILLGKQHRLPFI